MSLFKIAKMYHKNNVYKLNLLAIMKNIFFVFHSWLWHLDDDVFLKEQHQTNLELIIIDNEFVYEIEKIIDFRMNNKKMISSLIAKNVYNIAYDKQIIQTSIQFLYDKYSSTLKMFSRSLQIFITNILTSQDYTTFSCVRQIEHFQNKINKN